MATDLFGRPDWDQHARRDSELIDAVVTVRQLGRMNILPRKPHGRIDYALVYSSPKGTYDTYLPPRRPVTTRRYTAVYEVDTGVHPLRAELRLPSDNDAHEFEVNVVLDWQVTDPAQYVRSGWRNVPRMLTNELEQAARPVARQFPIGRSAAAESELLSTLQAGKPLGESAGLRANWTIRLRRDADNIEHERRLQAIHHSAEQATAEARHALELQRYEAQKVDFYQRHLAQGGVQAWALHLAQRPEDTQPVLDGMQKHELDLIQAQISLIRELLGESGGEAHELEGPKRIVLQMISDFFTRRLSGTPGEPVAGALPRWEQPSGYGHAPVPPGPSGDGER
ncbi:hypothetical protein MTF65_18960 [Streptomyces sp. APSN-46.1]|uniref:hypothetical protein n=1 Tax=Streptomyces sp. APSN-46.1 TaxID=2929049 RepID=UPI001FB2F6A4|nr:hypothetical protein [Streptomyces sp. APSN-46.1]MCJ1679381.1 hypothetical protein [Streptomyces sp. APSN-46.1]